LFLAIGTGFALLLGTGPTSAAHFTTIYTFSDAEGASPVAGLVMDQYGNMYGTTTSEGQNLNGNLFKLQPNGGGGWNYSVL
jgi:hypothetical protein